MYATSQGGLVIEYRVPSEYTGPYYVWKLGFEADTIKVWKSDGSMQYIGMSTINTHMQRSTRSVLIKEFSGTAASTFTVDHFGNYLFILVELYIDSTNCISTEVTTPAALVRGVFKVYGTSSSQWGEINASSYTSITLNRTSSNTHHMRIVGLGYGLWE